MKKLGLLLLGITTSLMVFAQQGHAQRRGMWDGNHGRKRVDRIEHLVKKLALSVDQKEQVKGIMKTSRANNLVIKNQLNVKQAQLKLAISTDESKKVINAYVKDINSLKSQMFSLKIDARLDMRELLSEDQKLIFDKLHYGRLKGRGHGKGRSRG